MKKEIYYCDICKEEIKDTFWTRPTLGYIFRLYTSGDIELKKEIFEGYICEKCYKVSIKKLKEVFK